jgi:hypothetical protein
MRLSASILPGFLSIGLAAGLAATAQDSGWFTSFEGQPVAPHVLRTDAQRLVDVGSVDTDGFTEMRISIAGEFKDTVPRKGAVGAILIPDVGPFTYLLEQEGKIVLATEVQVSIGDHQGDAIFYSSAVPAKVAFPAYRIYLYNETGSAANVNVYVYRVRL